MPRPRLSECERQVHTNDRATVCCFWCGQRGHFWYDKFEKKRCSNQPKLASGGGGAQQREQDEKQGQQSSRESIAQKNNAFEQDRAELLAPPVVVRVAENKARAEANALLAEIAEGGRAKRKRNRSSRAAFGQMHAVTRLIRRSSLVMCRRCRMRLWPLQIKLRPWSKSTPKHNSKSLQWRKRQRLRRREWRFCRSWWRAHRNSCSKRKSRERKMRKSAERKRLTCTTTWLLLTSCLARQELFNTDELKHIEKTEDRLFGDADVYEEVREIYGRPIRSTMFGLDEMPGSLHPPSDWPEHMEQIRECAKRLERLENFVHGEKKSRVAETQGEKKSSVVESQGAKSSPFERAMEAPKLHKEPITVVAPNTVDPFTIVAI